MVQGIKVREQIKLSCTANTSYNQFALEPWMSQLMVVSGAYYSTRSYGDGANHSHQSNKLPFLVTEFAKFGTKTCIVSKFMTNNGKTKWTSIKYVNA